MDMRALINILEADDPTHVDLDDHQPAAGWKLVDFDDLPKETQEDIIHWIVETHPHFKKKSDFYFEDLRANLVNLVHPPKVWVGTMLVKSLKATMARRNSQSVVGKYGHMLRQGPFFEFDPILVCNGKFLDGGHRLDAYVMAGRETIPVVEVGHLVKAPDDLWEAWLDGEDVAFDPGPQPSA